LLCVSASSSRELSEAFGLGSTFEGQETPTIPSNQTQLLFGIAEQDQQQSICVVSLLSTTCFGNLTDDSMTRGYFIRDHHHPAPSK
jgi:hypothetical protein